MANIEGAYTQTFLTAIYTSSPDTGLGWSRMFQEVKVPRFHDNGTGWW